jgi:flagellar biosynthesis protein FlhF
MNVKKFTAPTSREALRRVRDALGPDAVILSNRATDTGVEVLALASEDISSLSEPAGDQEMEHEQLTSAMSPGISSGMSSFASRAALHDPAPSGMHAGHATHAAYSGHATHAVQATQAPDDGFELPRMGNMSALSSPPIAAMAPGNPYGGISHGGLAGHDAAHSAPARSSHPEQNMAIAEMMQELRAMRGMMETQLAELAWGATQKREPLKGFVLREMLAAGFSPSLSRYVTEKLPQLTDEADASRWLKNILGRNLATMNNENEILEKGGVFALIGPTGVGKTTSTAKLAARCVMRHGTDKLALITTDGYRIGGHEQLRIYGKILGVMVHSVKDEADLRIALRELRGKHTVLIDTIGVSQRDNMVAEQVAMLSGTGTHVQRLLCLNATSTGETLSEVVRAYQGSGLSGCIMTKLDEAVTIGNVLDVIIRAKLNLYYVSNGQRVPEDLHLGDRAYLLDRAFKAKRDHATYQFQDAELPLIMSQTAQMREVHLG